MPKSTGEALINDLNDLSIADKRAIIESNLKQISASLYNLSLSKRVADMNEEKETAAKIVTEQTKLMKVRDFYAGELEDLAA